MDGLEYVAAFAAIGLLIGVRLLQRAAPEERYSDPRLLLLAIGAVAIAIVAGILVGTLLQ